MKMEPGKKAAVIHDISGFGKCSATVILPVMSAAGIQTSILPTAVLSTHTGGLDGFVYHDLTEELLPMAEHWKSLGLAFDACYSGFLGSARQIDLVSHIFDMFKERGALLMVDPVMGDDGRLYRVYDEEMCVGMRRLCGKADIIVPNLTEAAFLLGGKYRDGVRSREEVTGLLKELTCFGAKKIVVTGVSLEEGSIGAASLDTDTGKTAFSFQPQVPGHYHGTGDIFSSVLLSGLLKEYTLDEAMNQAVEFTAACIRRTYEAGVDTRYGVLFEQELYRLTGNGQ